MFQVKIKKLMHHFTWTVASSKALFEGTRPKLSCALTWIVNRWPFFPLKLLAVVINPVLSSILKNPPSLPDEIRYCMELKLPVSLSVAYKKHEK